MIVDVHTHVFPPAMIERRASLVDDPGFNEMYGDPAARMASAQELLASMDEAGVDVAVAAGFAWRDAERCAEHADSLLEAAATSGGRLLPFVPLPADLGAAKALVAERGAAWRAGGARGLGEVRVAGGDEAEAVEALAAIAGEFDLPLLVHASEPLGHRYPGKAGGLGLAALGRLIEHPSVRVIAAHWGGGLPFFALMPEVRAALESGRVLFDTAASPLLYEPRVFEVARALAIDELVAWGSDFPLRPQGRDRAAVEEAVTDGGRRAAILGRNAARFLGLE